MRLSSYQQRNEAETAEARTIKRRLQHGYTRAAIGVQGYINSLASSSRQNFLPGRARRMDRREVPRLVGLRRGCRELVSPRPASREHQPLLVHRCDRLVVLALLRAHARAVADSGRADHRRSDGVRSVSARDHPPAPVAGGAGLTATSGGGVSCRAVAISPRWSSRRRSPMR